MGRIALLVFLIVISAPVAFSGGFKPYTGTMLCQDLNSNNPPDLERAFLYIQATIDADNRYLFEEYSQSWDDKTKTWKKFKSKRYNLENKILDHQFNPIIELKQIIVKYSISHPTVNYADLPASKLIFDSLLNSFPDPRNP